MEEHESVLLNGQLCHKDIAIIVIDKVLPTVLEVVAELTKAGKRSDVVDEAAKTVVNAALGAISLRSLISPKP
ncbi:hypothetical protein ACMGGS_12045 [Superficieibacter sp. BNK-5]|uniref:hypothetical protein n=1 Tax=Superficieibacter sp. BNK-5 TaxID=3376142 RepID=UPI0039BEF4E0